MKMKFKALLTASLLMLTLPFISGCKDEKTPYQLNDEENYNVSVKFDANGGIFTTNTPVIVDSYNISDMTANSQGDVAIALLSPDNTARGADAFTAEKNGYFLAGWYEERTEQTDSNGNTYYTYGKKWDFGADRLTVAAGGTYSSETPVLTLYAAWVPLFEIEFYSRETGEHLATETFDPLTAEDFLVPAWDEEKGTINMFKFPKKQGYTFEAAYYDPEGTQPVDTGAVVHPGTLNEENGTSENASVKIYIDWTEGEWYRIYTAEQFVDNANPNGSYMICADLDFADETWPTAYLYGNFSGTIQGNGYTFKNIRLEQSNREKINVGLFGQITQDAQISDLKLENITFTVKAGPFKAGASFGLFAGTVSADAKVQNVQILSSVLQIDSGAYFHTEDYVIGLICGMGDPGIDDSGITCIAVGDAPESIVVTVTDGIVIVTAAA